MANEEHPSFTPLTEDQMTDEAKKNMYYGDIANLFSIKVEKAKEYIPDIEVGELKNVLKVKTI